MSGRWEGLRNAISSLNWLLNFRERRAQAKDMKPQPDTKLEENIKFILKVATNKAGNRASGVRIIVGPRDLRPGMVIDPATMAGPLKARAATYGLYAGPCAKGGAYFYKM